MTKQEARDIATVLIAKTATCFDGGAFEDCNPALTENEIDKIISAIEQISEAMILKIEKKQNVSFDYANSAHEIVDLILYE